MRVTPDDRQPKSGVESFPPPPPPTNPREDQPPPRGRLRTAFAIRGVIAAATVLGPIVAGLAIYALAIEPSRLVTNRTSVELDKWPPALDGLKVAVISDIHAGGLHVREGKLARLVRQTNAARPDLIAITGDTLVHEGNPGSTLIAPERVAAALKGLDAPLGVFAVLGNDDWYRDGLAMWRAFELNGIRVLQNDVARVEHRGTRFAVAGFADAFASQPDVAATLARVRPGVPVLALTHNPNTFTEIPPRVSLTVAGHTHGGQVTFPLIGRLVVPTDGKNYPRGVYRDHGRTFFVTVGVGESGLPVRFSETPEIALLTLRSPA